MEIRLQPWHQLVDRPRPEDASDSCSRLKRRLVGFGQKIDARGKHRLDRVRDLESRRKLVRVPPAVDPLEQTRVDEAAEHFLDENGFPSERSTTSLRTCGGKSPPSKESTRDAAGFAAQCSHGNM